MIRCFLICKIKVIWEINKNHKKYLYISESDIKVVVVHDAVRPFVPRSLLGELVRSAAEVGAAGPVRPLVSTVVKPGNDSCLDASLQRSAYAASETPQAFQFEILMSAYAKVKIYCKYMSHSLN